MVGGHEHLPVRFRHVGPASASLPRAESSRLRDFTPAAPAGTAPSPLSESRHELRPLVSLAGHACIALGPHKPVPPSFATSPRPNVLQVRSGHGKRRRGQGDEDTASKSLFIGASLASQRTRAARP